MSAVGEVLVPQLRLGQGQEVPSQVRGAQIALHGQDGRGVERRGRALVGDAVDDEPRLGDHLGGSRRSLLPRVLPRRSGARVGLRCPWADARVRSSRARKPPRARSCPRTTKKPVGLALPPPRRDRCRLLALPGRHQVQDRLPVARLRRLGILLAPGAPVHWRHDAGQAAEHVLGVGDRELLLMAPRGPEASVDVAADPTEHLPIAVGVAPAQIGLQCVAGQIVWEHTRWAPPPRRTGRAAR